MPSSNEKKEYIICCKKKRIKLIITLENELVWVL